MSSAFVLDPPLPILTIPPPDFLQRNYNFYPAWAYCWGGALVRIPDNLLMTTVWVVMVYWSVGFTAAPGQ